MDGVCSTDKVHNLIISDGRNMNTKVSLSALTLDGSYSSIFKNHGSEKRGRETHQIWYGTTF